MVESDGPVATEAFGVGIAAELEPGDVVHVLGDLGSGKTTVVRGACRALGVTVGVTSPTFAIAHRYPAAGGLRVAHIDLYRIDQPGTEDPELLAGYLDADTIAFVEWPRAGAAELDAPRLTITLTHLGGDRRRIEWFLRERGA